MNPRSRLLKAREGFKFKAWSATSAGRANNARVARLRNAYSGRRCVVMGNGPSLLKCDLTLLTDEVKIVSNAHYLIWDDLPYIPDFLTTEDVLVAQDRSLELRSLQGVIRVFPHDLRGILGDATEEQLYVNFPRHYRPFPQFSDDLGKVAYWGGTVSFLNLQLAAYLGCDPIVLIGFDHSYSVPKNIDGNVITSEGEDVNHIHPDYFGPGYRWHDPNVARMEDSYRVAKGALEAQGVRVLNATVGGHLEVFERTSYASLFGGH